MVSRSRETGRHYEDVAKRFLESRGLTTLERNFHCRMGELDLVMQDGPHTVFVEVRYRNRQGFGSGSDSVTWQKQRRLGAAARRYLMFNPRLNRSPCRFDVVSIGSEEGRTLIQWVRNAFELPG